MGTCAAQLVSFNVFIRGLLGLYFRVGIFRGPILTSWIDDGPGCRVGDSAAAIE